MLMSILLLIACAVIATVGAPLMLKVVPPNPYYGYPAGHIKSNPKRWIAVNAFAGSALVIAAAVTAGAIIIYNGTWLRSGFAQLAVFVVAVGAAVGATWWYERK
jgi:uncharacterized membrane protein